MFSVIIITRNRSEDLRNVSLRSLLQQSYRDFEVIVWDASDDDLAKRAVEEIVPAFAEKGICLNYFRAPRRGTASQRNDAAKFAEGDFVFFIDDDAEISADGLEGVQECITRFPAVKGVGLTVSEAKKSGSRGPLASVLDRVKHFAYDLVGYRSERKVSPCGSAKGLYALAGPAQWLSGCSMGFRKEVFDIFEFNEDLETFSPYALGEDIEFSHRVFRRYRKPLRIAAKGKVVHRPSPKPRFAATETALAARLYNRCHLMKAASANRPLRARAGFFWFFLRTVFAASFSLGVMPSFRSAVKVFSAFFYKSRERRV